MADPVAERRGRLVKAFQTTYVKPLLALTGLSETIVEFYKTEGEARVRTEKTMVDDLASRLPMYKQLREDFKDISLVTDDTSNLTVGVKPFETEESDEAFKALVKCCYTKVDEPKDCTKSPSKSGFYAVYTRKATVEDACIEGVIGMMDKQLVQPTDEECEKYKDLFDKQEADVAASGPPEGGWGGQGGGQGGGRRSRRRHRRGRKGSRRH
jgi:hypothetical protein